MNGADVYCIFCNTEQAARLWSIKQNAGREYRIFKCAICRGGFVWPRPQREEIDAIYESEAGKPTQESKGIYRPTAETDARRLFLEFGPHIRVGTLLDVGAGEGHASFAAKQRGFTVLACEPNPQARALFAEKLGTEPDPSFFGDQYIQQLNTKMDVAISSHVLEHIVDPLRFLQDLYSVVAPGGVVVISVPLFGSIVTAVLGERDPFVSPPVHLNYFSLAALRKLLARARFTTVGSYTSSKVNLERYRSRLGALRHAVNLPTWGLLRASELLHRSVVLNVCARRSELP